MRKLKECDEQSAPSLSWWMEKRKPLLKKSEIKVRDQLVEFFKNVKKMKECDEQSALSLSWWSALNRRLITTQPAGKENLSDFLKFSQIQDTNTNSREKCKFKTQIQIQIIN